MSDKRDYRLLPSSWSADEVRRHKSNLILHIRYGQHAPIRRMALVAMVCDIWLVLVEKRRRAARLDSAKHLLIKVIKGR